MSTTAHRINRAPGEDAQRVPYGVAILTCPCCGHVSRMKTESYLLWPDGVRCGLCGPPDPVMRAMLTPGR